MHQAKEKSLDPAMGVGFRIPSNDVLRIESELLEQALDTGLGFSHSQLSSAIKHFLKTFETVEEAQVMIPCDNFSIIVDYILENCDPSLDEITGKTETTCSFVVGDKDETFEGSNNKKDNSQIYSAGKGASAPKVCDPKRKMWLSEAISKKVCGLDRNMIHMHYRQKMVPQVSSKCVELGKDSSPMNSAQSVKTKNISAVYSETSELAVEARKDMTTEEASSSKSISSTVALDLEACLRKGDCDKALNIFTAWKNAGFKVGCQQIDTNEIRANGGEQELLPDIPGKKRGFVVCYDISRGLEKLPISCVNEYNTDILPEDFLYITKSVIRQSAHVDTSLSRIGDLHCSCTGDCLRSPEACKCTDATRGEYAYDENGRLIKRLATDYPSGWGTQKGDFITECCNKCCCSINCGNRVVQRGITKRLQIFMTPSRKGWGVRALERIPTYSFVFEYLGEIATNSEQFDRNMEYEKNGVYTYTMNLDADLDMEKKHFGEGLTDSELLVLDATRYGNVSRFLNHRCHDANLFMRPVQIETRDTHYYHAAFFAIRDIEAMEELTWDYGIDFSDDTHQVKAFTCQCKSQFCRDIPRKRKSGKLIGAKKNRRVTVSMGR